MQDKFVIDFSGTHGANGSSGSAGRAGQNARNGISARHIDTNLIVDSDKIIILEKGNSMCHMQLGNSQNSMDLYASGGNGGRGGDGGRGRDGRDGTHGKNATRYSSGTDGTPGEDGQDGGDGGDGGSAGHGGNINVNVRDEDTDLLMIIGEYRVNGGIGGEGGNGGAGGKGGRGGTGGSSYTWSEQYSDHQGHHQTRYHSNPGGRSGRNGNDGRHGQGGMDGQDGMNGRYQILVNKNGAITEYPEKYFLVVLSFDIVDSNDMIYEPGEDIQIQNFTCQNIGPMPSPSAQDIAAVLTSRPGLTFFFQEGIVYPREMSPQQQYIANSFLRFHLNQFKVPHSEGIPTEVVDVIPLSLVTRVNKHFGESFKRKMQVRWPVEISVPIAFRAITIEEESPFAIEIRNISSKPVGLKNDNSPRELYVQIEDITHGNNKVPLLLKDEGGNIHDFAMPYVRYLDILGKESAEIKGTIMFPNISTPLYTKVQIKVSLNLSKLNEQHTSMIQYRTYDIQLAEKFIFDNLADVIIVNNSSVSRDEMNKWSSMLRNLNLQFSVWNVTLYNTFSYKSILGEIEFAKAWKDKLVIILNHPFTNELNENKSSIQTIASNEVYEAAKMFNISTMIYTNRIEDILHVTLPMTNINPKHYEHFDDICKYEEAVFKKENKLIHSKTTNSGHKDTNIVVATTEHHQMLTDVTGRIVSSRAEENSDQSYQVLPIYKSYCCDQPTKQEIVDEIVLLKNKLQRYFPNRVYHFLYKYNPKPTEKGGCCKQWMLGEVEIRRGLDLDNPLNAHVGFSSMTNNNNQSTNAEVFGILKLLSFQKKIEMIRPLSQTLMLPLLIQAITSDLIDELDIFRKNTWSGLLNKTIIKDRMIILNTFASSTTIKALNQQAEKTAIESIVVKYLACANRITSCCDYMWFNRNRRIVRSVCEGTVNKLLISYFNREERASIKNDIQHLKLENPDVNRQIRLLINPYPEFFQKDFYISILDRDQVNLEYIPPRLVHFNQNKFFDPQSGIFNHIARDNALKECGKQCYFDIHQQWSEYDESIPNQQIKEYTIK